ncbi:hypothetical protein [Jeotgalibacillus terrae]|uniref:Uncharacterized protein n=1 Tax=Jeotgalibacillus terrae TaxID=587735 RepID=A0ABW5ZF01_9BACL|nr:hypothetical protein [Jeotgalibacillus terrae]MBM7580044.1 hypothetical protein [Jeotgalibacillus terrae]
MNVVIGQSGTIYNAKTLEELSHIDYVYMQIERVVAYIHERIDAIRKTAEGFIQFVIGIAHAWVERVKAIFGSVEKFKEEIYKTIDHIEQQKQVRRSWSMDVDTRVKSQVLDNRPQHYVRKILK